MKRIQTCMTCLDVPLPQSISDFSIVISDAEQGILDQ